MKSSRFRAIVILAATLLVLVAPHALPIAHAANPPLVIVVGYETAHLDPQINYDAGAATVLGSVYDSLLRAVGDKGATIVPDLATSWSASQDGKTWTFHLRPGVKFHDGSPVDAAAVKFTFDRLLTLNQNAVADFVEIGRVDAPEPLTVVFHLKTPFPSFFSSLSTLWGIGIVSPTTVKKHMLKATAADFGQKWLDEHDAGSGPWMITKWTHGQNIVLDPFPGYWRGWSGQHVGRVVIEWPASSSTQRLGLEHGDIDIAINMTPQDLDAVAKEPGIVVHNYTAQTIYEYRLNCTRGPLRNKLVRQALNYSFDYDSMVKYVYKGYASRMWGVGPTGLANYFPAAHPYTYDLNKAKSLLAKAGYANGFTLHVTWQSGGSAQKEMAQIWQADAAQIGIKITLQEIPAATYFNLDQKPTTEPDVFIGAWTMDYADDQQMYWSYYYSKVLPPASSNVMYYGNPAVDKLLVQAQTASTAAEQHAIYAKVLPIIYDDAPEIWAVQPDERIAMRSNVHGFKYNFLYSSFYFDLYALSKS